MFSVTDINERSIKDKTSLPSCHLPVFEYSRLLPVAGMDRQTGRRTLGPLELLETSGNITRITLFAFFLDFSFVWWCLFSMLPAGTSENVFGVRTCICGDCGNCIRGLLKKVFKNIYYSR